METVQISQINTPHPPRSKWRELMDNFPFIQFVGAGLIGLVATWTTVQLTQNSQAAEIRRQGEKIERLETTAVSRELFDERTRSMIDEQKKQRELLERIFDKK